MSQKQVDQLAPAVYESSEAKPMMNLSTYSPAVSLPRPFPAIRPGLGVKQQMKLAQFSIGIVQVKECLTPAKGQAYFELRYKDPSTGLDVKRRIKGLNLVEVKDIAKGLNMRAQIGKGHLASQPKAPSVEEGMIEAISLANMREHVRREQIRLSKVFVLWLADNYPMVQTWDQLRPVMVQRYVASMEQGDSPKAFDTVRLALVPVKQAWRVMSENWPELVKPMPRVKLARPPRREIVCLEQDEVATLLDWMKANAPDLWPMACLQALCGLRTLEAAALRVQDVDVKAGTVTVTDTGHHKPKTRNSYRTIPVCDEVMEALKVAMVNQKVKPASGEIFTNQAGNLWVKDSLGQRWRRVLNHVAARPEKIKRKGTGKPLTLNAHGLDVPRLALVPARKLRAAFATMAGRLGAQDRLVKAYLGHSSGDMLGDHYRRIDLDELRLVSGMLNGWREAAKAAETRKETGNIPLSDVSEC